MTAVSTRKSFEELLKDRQNEYVDTVNFRVFVGTWNVNNKQTAENLDKWLECDENPPDVYAVGFQELDTSIKVYFCCTSEKELQWQEAVHRSLHAKANYEKVASIRLCGVLLVVYVKKDLKEHVKLIDTDNVPFGLFGKLGNKGSVGVRLSLHETSLCFINSHLAAHPDRIKERNQGAQVAESKMFQHCCPPLSVQDHNIVFWFGDLNYRIDMAINDVKEHMSKEAFDKLLHKDQLYSQLSTHPVYKTYTEGKLLFQPTYKYMPGINEFDFSRIPAWCDRILWKGNGCRQIIYRSHPTLRISDHKPVSALFDADIKVVQEQRKKKVSEDIMMQLDKQENERLPQVTFAQFEFNFKDVKFSEPQKQILAVINIGQVAVICEFINKRDEVSFCKPWLKVSPVQTVIQPGYSTEIILEVTVDKTLAYKFNRGHEKIEDILVMHLHGGRDFFIPITGNYIVSSFGSSIEALVQMRDPIREIPADQLVDLESRDSLDHGYIVKNGFPLRVCPKEIFRLLAHISYNGRHQEDSFMQPGLNTEIHQIRDCLDTGMPEELPGSIDSVTEALVLFLDALAEPVIPYRFYETCLNSFNDYILCKRVVSQLPDCRRNVFKCIFVILRKHREEVQYSYEVMKKIARMFGDVLLRPPPERLSSLSMNEHQAISEDLKKTVFVCQFLDNENEFPE